MKHKNTKTTNKLVAKIRRAMNNYSNKMLSACGYEAEQFKAFAYQDKALEAISIEIEQLVQKGVFSEGSKPGQPKG